jgi:NAD(P)-dependent dehydrogenase (short-subunit alcohol dehydrogenase family)
MTRETTSSSRRSALRGLGLLGLSAAGLAAAATGTAARAQSAGPAPAPRGPLAGKVAIVTGARANLGRAFAVGLARQGADIVVHVHREATRDQGEETVRLIETAGGRAVMRFGDLGERANVVALFDAAEQSFGGVDILINNAGKIIKKPMEQVSEAEFDACHRVNTKAVYFAMQQAATRMRAHGRVINIGTSLLGPGFIPNYSAYNGTKAPLEEFTRAFAREQGARGITANVICPGALDTPFFHAQETPQSTEIIRNFVPVRRLGTIEDIEPVVRFIASEESRWVTGQTLWINGGNVTR